jgi:hypothetical protein
METNYRNKILESCKYKQGYHKVFTAKEIAHIETLTEEEFRDNETYIRKILENDSSLLFIASPRLRDKEDIVELSITNWNPGVVKYLSPRLAAKKEIIKQIIEKCAFNIKFVNKPLNEDMEIAELVLKDYYAKRHLKYLGGSVWYDKDFSFRAYIKYPSIQKLFTYEITEDFIIEGLRSNPEYILDLPKKWLTKNVLDFAITSDCLGYLLASECAVYAPDSNDIFHNKKVLNYIERADISLLKYIDKIYREDIGRMRELAELSNKKYQDFILEEVYIK